YKFASSILESMCSDSDSDIEAGWNYGSQMKTRVSQEQKNLTKDVFRRPSSSKPPVLLEGRNDAYRSNSRRPTQKPTISLEKKYKFRDTFRRPSPKPIASFEEKNSKAQNTFRMPSPKPVVFEEKNSKAWNMFRKSSPEPAVSLEKNSTDGHNTFRRPSPKREFLKENSNQNPSCRLLKPLDDESMTPLRSTEFSPKRPLSKSDFFEIVKTPSCTLKSLVDDLPNKMKREVNHTLQYDSEEGDDETGVSIKSTKHNRLGIISLSEKRAAPTLNLLEEFEKSPLSDTGVLDHMAEATLR
ncbi:12501_t:CDS:1, partial [Acaulospora colombiana]